MFKLVSSSIEYLALLMGEGDGDLDHVLGRKEPGEGKVLLRRVAL